MNKIRRYPFVSGILGFIVPGLGQLYNGKSLHFMIFAAIMFAGDAVEYMYDLTHTLSGLVTYAVFVITLQLVSALISVITSIRNGLIERKAFQRWYVYALIITLLIAVSFVHSPLDTLHSYYIPTGSMKPTIEIGDRIIAGTEVPEIRRGDILIFRPPTDEIKSDYIKRCVAVPGDRISIHDGALYLNGKRQDENYTRGETTYDGFGGKRVIEGTVPGNSYVMLGDNRTSSLDSRYFGYVPRERITGKILYIWYSYDRNRIGKEF